MMSSFGLGRNIPVICEAEKHCGSSPRMRGKLWQIDGQVLPLRIIPAHARQTQVAPPETPGRPDHPRACGANVAVDPLAQGAGGSSPRMRGKLGVILFQKLAKRIIPAHAGQTARHSTPCNGTPNHPRACGANSGVMVRRHMSVGSSPRMRGKPCGPHACRHRTRIIPAHAGQTPKSNTSCSTRSDHPRACGANSGMRWLSVQRSGSSPRMRGKQRVSATGTQPARIIPAHAGQTAKSAHSPHHVTDHPRACGANPLSGNSFDDSIGSSPRMRGKRARSRGRWPSRRIIPAHAGQTPAQHSRRVEAQDHPRACGANGRPRRRTM